jgi:hypothetical protein
MRKEASGQWRELSQHNVEESVLQPEAGPSSVPQTEDVTMESLGEEPPQSPSDMSTDTVTVLLAQAFSTEMVSTPFSGLRSMPGAERRQWYTACKEELDTLKAHGVYAIIDLPLG